MNSTRMVVIGLVGLLIGVLLGFGFRGSLAEVLSLEAYTIPPTSIATNSAADTTEVFRAGYKETDLYSRANGVKIPVTILLNQPDLRALLLGQGFPGIRIPSEISFDLGTMTAAEKTAVDACMNASTVVGTTYSQCLVDHVIKPRATTKSP